MHCAVFAVNFLLCMTVDDQSLSYLLSLLLLPSPSVISFISFILHYKQLACYIDTFRHGLPVLYQSG